MVYKYSMITTIAKELPVSKLYNVLDIRGDDDVMLMLSCKLQSVHISHHFLS